MTRKNIRYRFSAATTTGLALAMTALLAIGGCAGKGPGAGGFSMPPTPVEVTQAKLQKVTDTFNAIGTIDAIEAVQIVTEIDAAVISLPFEEGSSIKKGDLIAQLDDSQLSAELARTQALFEQSETSYSRIKGIVEKNLGSQQDLDDAAAALKVAQANLAIAQARFDKTRITAPFDGVVGARKVSVGSFLRTGQTITELANVDNIRVNFSAPESFLSRLTRGAEVSVSTTAYPDYKATGQIIVIEPMLDPGTRNGRLVAKVSNPQRKFFPGMSADISVVLAEREGAIAIPNEAVFATGNQSFVYIVKPDSTTMKAAVTLGTRLSDVVEVLKGIEPGAVVVTAGHQKLYDGAKVMPMIGQVAVTK
jgi:membrane fusion protein, multidrug efflux system